MGSPLKKRLLAANAERIAHRRLVKCGTCRIAKACNETRDGILEIIEDEALRGVGLVDLHRLVAAPHGIAIGAWMHHVRCHESALFARWAAARG